MFSFFEHVMWARARQVLEKNKTKLIGITGSTGTEFIKDALMHLLGDNIHTARYTDPSTLAAAATVLGVRHKSHNMGLMHLLVGSRLREIAKNVPPYVALEIPTAKPSRIDFLAAQLPFDIAAITNVHTHNLDLYGSKNRIAHEMASLALSVKKGGSVILNGDDPLVRHIQPKIKASMITFGKGANLTIRLMRADRRGVGFACEIQAGHHPYEVSVPHIAIRAHLHHLLATAAIAHAIGLNMKTTFQRLQTYNPPKGYGRLFKTAQQARILDMSLGTTAEDMISAITSLQTLPGSRRIIIAGDMENLGHKTIDAHQQIGEAAVSAADVFIAVGESMQHAAKVILAKGKKDIHRFLDSRDVNKWLAQIIQPEDLILVGGGRSMHMEEILKPISFT